MSPPNTTAINFTNPHFEFLADYVRSSAARKLPMVQKDRHKSARGAVIVSTGPSIEVRANFRRVKTLVEKRGYTLIALKEALGYLRDRGLNPTYAVAMDPGGGRQIQRTPIVPGVTYCVASSCNPEFFDYLIDGGATVEVFHSACGVRQRGFAPGVVAQPPEGVTVPDGVVGVVQGVFDLEAEDGGVYNPLVPVVLSETDLYGQLFPCADVMMGGYACLNRAVSLVRYMGFRTTVLAGADFAWRSPTGDAHYASFVEVGPAGVGGIMNDGGSVDGQPWYTRPDQLGSAVDLARRVKSGHAKIIGDSLAASLALRSESFLRQVVQSDVSEKSNP